MVGEGHNLSGQLIAIIERNAEALARGAVEKLQNSPRTPSYHRLSSDELYNRAYDVYHNLGHWLWKKSDQATQAWYHELGKKRFNEGIPLSETLWALVLTKYHLRDYLAACALAGSAIELYRHQELDRLVCQFFDRAVCYTAEGYERRPSVHRKDAGATMAS